MASERQLQDRENSTQEDSLGIQDAQQISESPANLDPKDDREHLRQVDLLTKKLKDKLNAVDTSATVD